MENDIYKHNFIKDFEKNFGIIKDFLKDNKLIDCKTSNNKYIEFYLCIRKIESMIYDSEHLVNIVKFYNYFYCLDLLTDFYNCIRNCESVEKRYVKVLKYFEIDELVLSFV